MSERQARSGPEVIRIRKYPNRRLYDTSRSCHLTHQGVVQLVTEGKTVQVTDSRSGADITNIVLLQIIIERDPAKLQSLPNALLHKVMRAEAAELQAIANELLEGRGGGVGPKSGFVATQPVRTPVAPERVAPPSQPSRSVAAPASNGTKSWLSGDDSGRTKARAKRND